jgi:hypothetical protein
MESAPATSPAVARDLQVRVTTAGRVDPHPLGDELLQTGSLRKPQDRRQTRARHKFGSSNR